jgi:hypothetical protein
MKKYVIFKLLIEIKLCEKIYEKYNTIIKNIGQ